MPKQNFWGDGEKPNPKGPRCFDDDDSPAIVKSKKAADKDEKRLSRKMKFRQQPNSGACLDPRKKGDGVDDEFMYECKRQANGENPRIDHEWLEKMRRQASLMKKTPVLVLTVVEIPEPLEKDWVFIPASTFTEMKNRLSKDED